MIVKLGRTLREFGSRGKSAGHFVVVLSPVLRPLPSGLDVEKGKGIKQFVADPHVEGFDLRILSRLAG
jgi:hypothetical protein